MATDTPLEPNARHPELEELRTENRRLQEELVETARAKTRVLLELVGQNERREREVEKQQRVLKAALELARRAARKKDEFLAVMGHELRTPLSGVLGMLSLVLDSDLTDEQRDCLRIAHDSARHLLTVLEDVRAGARLDTGQLPISPSRADLWVVVEEVVELLDVGPRAPGVDFVLFVAPDVPRDAYVDATRLRQVLANLCGNALKFTPRGSVTLSLTRVPPGEGHGVRFEVRDTGTGISPALVPHLFDQPCQDPDAGTPRTCGAPGMATSQGIVRRMGGRIRVESRVGRGSRFWFDLDVAGESRPAPRAASRRVVALTHSDATRDLLRAHGAASGLSVEAYWDAEAVPEDAPPADVVLLDRELLEEGGRLPAQVRRLEPHTVLLLAERSATPTPPLDDVTSTRFLPRPLRPSRLVDLLCAPVPGAEVSR